MSVGSVFKNVIRFAFPLMITNLLQVLYNAADVIVVGRWAGDTALAAVGSTGALYNLLVNVFSGLSIGASIAVSKRYGARDNAGIYRSVHTAMLLSIFVGLFSGIFGIIFVKPILVMMDTPAGEVLDGAMLYMRILFVGVPASLIYNFGAAILRAVGDTKRPLYILSATGLVNVVLNLILVIGFDMDVAGVAIATTTANYLSMFAVLGALIRSDGAYKLFLNKLHIYKEELKEIIRIGLPAGIQGSVFSLSNVVVQSAINSFGTATMVGNAAASNIEGFSYTAMNSFYQATLTSVSQNYGAKNKKRVYQSVWISLICAGTLGLVLGILINMFAEPLLGIYITDSPEAIMLGKERLMVICAIYFLCGMMEVLTGALRGLGYSTITAVNSLVGACGFRMIWVFWVLPAYRSIQTLYLCYPLSWSMVILLHVVCLLFVKKRAFQRMYEQL